MCIYLGVLVSSHHEDPAKQGLSHIYTDFKAPVPGAFSHLTFLQGQVSFWLPTSSHMNTKRTWMGAFKENMTQRQRPLSSLQLLQHGAVGHKATGRVDGLTLPPGPTDHGGLEEGGRGWC